MANTGNFYLFGLCLKAYMKQQYFSMELRLLKNERKNNIALSSIHKIGYTIKIHIKYYCFIVFYVKIKRHSKMWHF